MYEPTTDDFILLWVRFFIYKLFLYKYFLYVCIIIKKHSYI